MFKLVLYKTIGNKQLYKIQDLDDEQYLRMFFRDKPFDSLIVVDHKTKEIVLHDIYNELIKDVVQLINERKEWNNYKLCNGWSGAIPEPTVKSGW